MMKYNCENCGFIINSEWPADELICPECGGSIVDGETPPDGFEPIKKFYDETQDGE